MSAPVPPPWQDHLPEAVTPNDVNLLADESLPGRWRRRWRERPAAPAVVDVDGTWVSAEDLEERTRQAAARLRAVGGEPGDRLLLSGAPSLALVVAYVAALRAGLIVVPVNPGYTLSELARIVHAARAKVALVGDHRLRSWVGAAAREPVATVGLDLDELLPARRLAPEPDLDRACAADPALLVYTSGTTGAPKGALLSHRNLLASATAVNLAWRWQPDDALLLTLPLFHVHGLGVGVNGSLCAGASILLRPRFDAADVAERAGHGISLFFGVPAMYQRLAASGAANVLRGLRLLVSGSAPLAPELAREIHRQSGQLPLERYGMTETVMLTSNPVVGERRPGTVGFPLPGVEVRLAPEETERAGEGRGREVEVRGPNVIAGYYKQAQATAAAFTSDGWFRTGDLGAYDDAGYLVLVGRSKDLIITGGFNVHPREVEEAIESHPAVREAAVIGRPSERWGEEVVAVVVTTGPVAAESLRAHAGTRVAPYKVPKRIEFAEALPRNALGKLLRDELR